MISVALCFLAVLLWALHTLRYGFVLSVCVTLLLYGVEILGYSACGYYLSCFGEPSVLSVALSVLYCAKIALVDSSVSLEHRISMGAIVARVAGLAILPYGVMLVWAVLGLWLYLGALGIGLVDIYHIDSRVQVVIISAFIAISAVYGVMLVWAVLGLWLYLGALGIGLVDIYHIDSRVQVVIISAFIAISAVFSRIFALLACAGLWHQICTAQGLYDGVLDVGLWLWCVLGLLWRWGSRLFKGFGLWARIADFFAALHR